MNLDNIRECLYEITNYENLSKCMYEVIQLEGFLPDTLTEGDSYENHFSAIMEDDDMTQDIYETIMNSSCKCGNSVKEWIKENYGIDTNDSPVTEEAEGHMYIARLDAMKSFIENILSKIPNDSDLESWIQDKITMSFQNLESVSLYYDGEDHSGTNTPETNDIDVEMPETSLVAALSENELPKFSPKKGVSVDKENKKNSKSDDKEIIDSADKTQKTVEQKVADKINVKFSPDMESDDQKEINKTHLGAWNALNLDFQNGVPDSYKKRVEMEVLTGHSRKRDEAKFGKEANVDHESTERIGKAIMAASVANQEARDDMYKPNPIITKPYNQTSITGGNKDNSKKLNEEVDRIKEIFNK